MTEKRFELSLGEDTDGYIIDKIKHKSYFLRSDDVKKEITEILNQFYNENEDLKTDISVLNRHYDEYGKICAKLKDENEQLKKQREELFIRERDTKNDWRELRRENEQLKQSYAQLEHRHSLLHDVCLDAECDRDRYHKDVLSLEKENGELKQFKKQVFQLIDEKIKECDIRECDCCRNCIADQLLGELKKELQE